MPESFPYSAARACLDDGLARMGLEAVDKGTREALLIYLAEMLRWGKVHNLTGVVEPLDMVRRHLLDSLAFLPFLPAGAVVDVGSGAGLPGIPLAAARPEQEFFLVEPGVKRAAFLQHIRARLQLSSVMVCAARVESADLPASPDVLVSRATAPVPRFLRMVDHLLRPGTRLLLAKGPGWQAEIAQCPPEVTGDLGVHHLEIPGIPGRVILDWRVPPGPVRQRASGRLGR